MPRPPDADVPCGTCTACCHNEMVTLHPEDGDDVASYDCVPDRDPLGQAVTRLRLKADRSCVYLEKTGCSIYDRRPIMCRAFDCRGMVRMLGLVEALRVAMKGDPVIRRGLQLEAERVDASRS